MPVQPGFRWEKTPEEALGELGEAYASAIHQGVKAVAQRWAPEIQNWMGDNAPWTDRTGNARQSLYSEVEEVVNQMVTIIFSHGVYYGVYLELCNAGRYAIISLALDHFAPKIWADVQRMLS
jgi:hypothetical protein